MASELLVPFLGALQASIAVLLTIFAGVVASQFQLISEGSSKEISKVSVRLFLPALLIVNVGSQLHADTGMRYIPILIWSLLYQTLSLLLGHTLTKTLNLPSWITPAIAFNNTTSLPLLLIQALSTSGILSALDPSPSVIDRAKSYFLVNAMVSNSLTFALGPKFLDCSEDLDARSPSPTTPTSEEDDANLASAEEAAERENEETSLLPSSYVRKATRTTYTAYAPPHKIYLSAPHWLQSTLSFAAQFVNPPLIGALLGALIGLVPPLHKLFFADQAHGGYLSAWLTSALRNIGDLFASLQVVVVGVKLSVSMLKLKKGESSGKMPWGSFALVALIRFVLWPGVSMGVVYALATKTGVLGGDPMLWFAMMLMPTGPPALALISMADVNGAMEEEKLTIAKFLTMCYAVSPLICFAVVGSLKVSQAATAS